MHKRVKKDVEIEEKLKYIGLDLRDIPDSLQEFEQLQFRIPKFYNEKQYRQYRYVPINKIQILLSPTNRLEDLQEKYKKARPLADYLDSENEENILRYTTFLNMLKQVEIEEIKKIEEEQENLNKKIPFKVKFEGNYLWQIYYSENVDKYFMLVPIEDSDYSAFFYLLKKKIEDNDDEKVFVPISNMMYSSTYLKKSEFEDIENYLWLFTKDWPLVYEVYDKQDKLTIQIIGETEVYQKIKSPYKFKLNNKVEANRFYKLLKALFILQTELQQYFTFKTNISKTGEIEFYLEDEIIEYETIADFIDEQYEKAIELEKIAEELIEENTKKLQNLQQQAAEQEIEYLAKEKQISTFLECKKSFFGRFKYYFKYSKKNQKHKVKEESEEIDAEENRKENKQRKKTQRTKKKNCTLEELIEIYKEYEIIEGRLKDLLMDINAIKLKNKNMKKKIENATMFINEIDSHKKSIFEFWKYSNKDEVAALAEGEEEEVNIIKKITKVFDYDEDFENFGKMMDKVQRSNLTKEQTDSIYITTTNILDILNKVKNNEALPKDIELNLKQLKKEAIKEKIMAEDEEFDIFGGIMKDNTKVSQIDDKKHRELPKDKFSILEINKNTKQIGYKMTLVKVIENIKEALKNIVVSEDIPVYKAIDEEKLNAKNINIFNINAEDEIREALREDKSRIKFYKINLKRGTNAVSYTNIIFYDNQNKTLPIGQNLSSKILVDISKLPLILKKKESFKMITFEDSKNDFSKAKIKMIMVYEYDIKENDKTK